MTMPRVALQSASRRARTVRIGGFQFPRLDMRTTQDESGAKPLPTKRARARPCRHANAQVVEHVPEHRHALAQLATIEELLRRLASQSRAFLVWVAALDCARSLLIRECRLGAACCVGERERTALEEPSIGTGVRPEIEDDVVHLDGLIEREIPFGLVGG